MKPQIVLCALLALTVDYTVSLVYQYLRNTTLDSRDFQSLSRPRFGTSTFPKVHRTLSRKPS